MTGSTKGPGRPRLPDSEPPRGNPVLSRLRAADLDERDLQARRYTDRMRKRAYRETRRQNASNPQRIATGPDGLLLMQASATIAAQDAAIARRDREITALKAQLEKVRR